MYVFQQKVAELREIEPVVYTICLSLTDNEQAACAVAKRALTALFQDNEFWILDARNRRPYILKQCLRSQMGQETTNFQKKQAAAGI
ncbi:hypothetical protein B1748_13995 [Paenibacillus sp. MY03]|uniref:Uncharacterized protein n=2 Tax=Paenibacillus agaridevorans TaxID=171404 RepID=A0A2R5ERS4_9BACL|nr:hypothetical protein [Paenibacillus sp. MY03]OUS75924.1 hypothetical protein B1748_13995 [Paenibacillus sp. MY03]GBG09380.1 hypothetical protein PAT3040_04024 [Paenibacillus agaridevorans]